MHNPEKGIYGSLRWYNEKGQLHREDGPAFIRSNGDCFWRKNGKRHRENGPAVEWSNGYKEWWVDGKFVRAENDNEQS